MLILDDFWTPFGSPLEAKNPPKTLLGRYRATFGTLRGLRGRFWTLRGWFGEPPGLILEHFSQQTTSNNSKQQQTTTNNNKQRQTTTNDNKQQQTTTNNNTQQQTGIRVRHRPLRGLTKIGDATSL